MQTNVRAYTFCGQSKHKIDASFLYMFCQRMREIVKALEEGKEKRRANLKRTSPLSSSLQDFQRDVSQAL